MWMDLGDYVKPKENELNGWAAHRRLRLQFVRRGVFMGDGEVYRAERPGWFRLVFAMKYVLVAEGVKR